MKDLTHNQKVKTFQAFAWIGSIFITLFFYEIFSSYIASKLNVFEFFENTGLFERIWI